jgi:hypothetical protein
MDKIRGKKRRPTQPPAPVETGWYFNYGDPNPVMETPNSFLWTQSPYVEPHYMLHPHGPLDASKSLTIKYRIDAISGTPDFQSTECGTKSPVGTGKAAMIIRKNLNNSERFNRAWCKPPFRPLLVPGETTITMPLNGEGWGFVYGNETPQTHPQEWANLLANCRDIGLTFNGCSSAGHGAYVVGGNARMTILSVTVA